MSAATVTAACAPAADDVPHRGLATNLFPGREELNNPLGACP
jgi:hypothetical protein